MTEPAQRAKQTRYLPGDLIAPKTNRLLRMQAYDSLPPAVRKALREAWHDWCPVHTANKIRFGTKPKAAIASIRMSDRLAHQRSILDAMEPRR